MGFLRKIGSSKSLREKASKDAYRPPTPPPQLPPLPDHIRRSESKSTHQSNNTQQRAQRRRSRSLWGTSEEAKVARTGLQRRDSFCGSTFTTDSSPSSQPWRSRDAWLALHTPSTPTIVNELTFPCSLDPPTPGWRGRGGGGFFAGTEAMTDADKIKSARGDDGDSIFSLPPRSRSRAATLASRDSPTPSRSKLAYPTPPLDSGVDDSPMSPTMMPKTGLRRPSHNGSQIESLPPVSALPPPRAVSPVPTLPPTPTTPRAPARSNSVTTTARDSTSSGDHGSQSPVTPQQSTQLLQAPPSNFLPSEAKVPWGQASRSASPILFRNDSTSTTHSSRLSARSSTHSSRARIVYSPKPPSRALPATPPDSDSGHSNEEHGLPYDQPQQQQQHNAVDITDEAGGEVIDFTRPRSPAAEQAQGPSSDDLRRSLSSSRGRRSSIQSSYETHESFNSVGSGAFYTPPPADSPAISGAGAAAAQGFFAPPLPVPAGAAPVSSTLPTPLSRSGPSSGLVIPPPRSTSRPPSRSASRASRSSHGHSSHGHDMPYTPATAQYPTIAQWRAVSADSPSPAPAPAYIPATPQSPPPLVQSLQPQKTGGSLRSMRRSSRTSLHRSMKSASKADSVGVTDAAAWNPASPVPDPFAGPWEQPAPYEIGFNPEHQAYAAPLRLPQKTNRLPSLRGNGRLAKAGWI
ncbi:hypothetical protein A1Q2_01830 [Trichosporon asahii var. asahii CBS 8904]|uniref:Uncharacterized protein n=1 Tax=Trichosporon asahii var. asahii (strain CBS 8904) TaxID=1220162 RepID=K1VWI6_TRIAC|nr:hypothetical protein A1Q2_01830 [Trichosporon asahii var. asahii CBS 8904]